MSDTLASHYTLRCWELRASRGDLSVATVLVLALQHDWRSLTTASPIRMFRTRYHSDVLRTTDGRGVPASSIVRAFCEAVQVEIDAGAFRLRSMGLTKKPSLKQPRTVNYSAAIAKAVEWLGDRYLLAKPINASADRTAGVTHIVAAGQPNSWRRVARPV